MKSEPRLRDLNHRWPAPLTDLSPSRPRRRPGPLREGEALVERLGTSVALTATTPTNSAPNRFIVKTSGLVHAEPDTVGRDIATP